MPEERNNPTVENIRAIVELEQRLARQKTTSERISDGISRFAGSLVFVLVHVVAFAAWAVWNALAPEDWRFDPYPYGLLTFIVSLEGVLIATFVLITQNRMSAQADHRDRLNLEVDLLAEQEMTLMLKMLRRISDRLEIVTPESEAAQIESYGTMTDVDAIARRLEEELPAVRDEDRRQ